MARSPACGSVGGRASPGARSSLARTPTAQGPDFPVSRNPNSGCRDVARKYRNDRAREVVAVLQKKRALLGEKHSETLVDRNLRLIGFDLAEVRIDGRVEHETVVQNELRVQPDLRLQRAVLKQWMARVAVINVAKPAQAGRKE